MQKERFGDAVKRIRTEKGMSLEDVRKRARGQLATSYISKIENNDAHPATISVGMMERLATGLGEPLQHLCSLALGIEESMDSVLEARLLGVVKGMSASRVMDLISIAVALQTSSSVMSGEAAKDGPLPAVRMRVQKEPVHRKKTGT